LQLEEDLGIIERMNLAKDICDSERLEIPEDIPKFYAELMLVCINISFLTTPMG